MSMNAEQARGVLAAYQQVIVASWPTLHPEMAAKAKAWATAAPEALERELQDYLRIAANAASPVRVFWKLLPGYIFGGCNEGFARDAGLTVADMIGHDDFDKRLPWVHQAAKYRADDEAVVKSGQARLDIVERQREATGQITWVRVGKTPIRTAAGVIGVLGAYEVLDAKTGHKLFAEKSRGAKKRP
jgi:PAS domain-containing protein